MMRTMRDNTKWIMLITMLAFAALMVFEWGMDITGRTAGLSELGEVDGVPVLYDQYQFAYRNLYERTQLAQEEAITSDQNLEIEDAAFDEVVTQILIRRELERRGIRVSDDEIRQAARFSPPPQFQGLEGFQTDGVFDMQKYQDYLATASELALLELEAYYRDIIPRTKLMRQLSTGIYLPDAALWSAYRDENEQVESATCRWIRPRASAMTRSRSPMRRSRRTTGRTVTSSRCPRGRPWSPSCSTRTRPPPTRPPRASAPRRYDRRSSMGRFRRAGGRGVGGRGVGGPRRKPRNLRPRGDGAGIRFGGVQHTAGLRRSRSLSAPSSDGTSSK